MTTEEFEVRKQAIIELVYKTDQNSNNLVRTTAMRIILTKAINKLQPPEPPTCGSCKHFTQALDNAGSCQKLVANEIINFIDGITTLVFTDFGCIYHSSYGEVKDE